MNPETKDTNPKDAVGIRKVGLSVLPFRVLWGVALAMLEGARKYGRHNYRVAGVRGSVYFDACQRHLGEWWEGNDIDPDSQLHHIDKAIASLMVLRDGIIEGNWQDDRPPAKHHVAVGHSLIDDANRHAGILIDEYPDPVPAYTQVSRDTSRAPAPGCAALKMGEGMKRMFGNTAG